MSCGEAFIIAEGTILRIGNDKVELGFDLQTNGSLFYVVDRQSGYRFRRDESAPGTLFKIELRDNITHDLMEYDSREGVNFSYEKKKILKSVPHNIRFFCTIEFYRIDSGLPLP